MSDDWSPEQKNALGALTLIGLSKLNLEPRKPIKVSQSIDFLHDLGLFYSIWSNIDLVVDYAITQFLNVSDESGHLLTAGTMFGRKARLLADLVARSDHPQKARILGAINAIRGGSKRDVFAHGYILSNDEIVTFVERKPNDKQSGGIPHSFTLAEFSSHVRKVITSYSELWDALDKPSDGVKAFAQASLSMSRKSDKSPGKSGASP